MAILEAAVSTQMLDSRGEVVSFDQPFKLDSTVTTIPNIVSWIQGLGVAIDTITDSQILKLRVSILIPLPGGIKSAPNTGTDNEKTALFTMNASGTANAYGDDLPSIQNTYVDGNQVDIGALSVAAYLTYITTVTTGITPTDRYGNALLSARRGSLTFRKHRRALRRA